MRREHREGGISGEILVVTFRIALTILALAAAGLAYYLYG